MESPHTGSTLEAGSGSGSGSASETPGFESVRFPVLNYVSDDEKKISRKDEVLLTSILEWYNSDESRVQQFTDIVKHRNGLSLRIIDWLITNFSKKVSVSIETHGLPGDLYRDYHKNLSAHNKKNFDPFARRQRICIIMFGRERRFSTIGQLNFFRWFLQKNLCSFLLENKSVIERHMRDYEKSSKKRSVKKFTREKSGGVVPADPADPVGPAGVVGVGPVGPVADDATTRCKPQAYSGSFTLSF
jgi:hypothetical protein